MMEVEVTTGAIRRAELQANCHHQQTNIQLITGQTLKGTIMPHNAKKRIQ